MIQIKGLTKSYGTRTLFEDMDFSLEKGEKAGLVGRNGHGKTTLFKIIQGEEGYEKGNITFPKHYRIGYLQQHLHFTRPTLLQEGIDGLPDDEKDLQFKVEKILLGLGFKKDDFQSAPQTFSGGFQIRLHLAKALLSAPDLLLLDEPTNYLDIVSIRWLIRILKSWKGELILITHDRGFMDQVTTHTMGLHRQKLKKVKGPTDKYYDQLRQEEDFHEQSRIQEEKRRKEIETFIERFRAKASKAAQVQSRIRQLEGQEIKDKLDQIKNLHLRFPLAPFPGKNLLQMEQGLFHYPKQNILFQNLRFWVQKGDRIGVIGKNGQGKSTLLRILAGEEKLVQGNLGLHPSTKIGYFGQTNIERLSPDKTVAEEIASFVPDEWGLAATLNLCGKLFFSGEEAHKRISVLSGGEKSRVLLGRILASPSNLLLLDEPTNHLDMEAVESLQEAMLHFEGGIVFVTHNEKLLQEVATKLVVFQSAENVQLFDGTYQDFLTKMGWDEEKGESESTATSTKGLKLSYKEFKIKKSEWVKERSKTLGPLRERQNELERTIEEKEKQMIEKQNQIISLSMQNSSSEIAGLSKDLKHLEKEIESLFLELEDTLVELEKNENFFQEKLQLLEQSMA